MSFTPRTKLIVFGYGLLAVSMAWRLENFGLQLSRLGWLEVAAWAAGLFLMPMLVRRAMMRKLFDKSMGWLCLLACLVIVAFGPTVAAKPGPWGLYLGKVFEFAFGAYLFLLDRQMQQYVRP